MKTFNFFAACAIAAIALGAVPAARSDVNVAIGIEPNCPYGYYDTNPYGCAPYGYYGSEWFTGGVFVGAGPWFHGNDNFRGHVNNRMHPDHGYTGATPERGAKAEPSMHVDKVSNFHGNEIRDGRGHASMGGHAGGSHGGAHAGGHH